MMFKNSSALTKPANNIIYFYMVGNKILILKTQTLDVII
ncbi:hypothetical protein A464_1727 [Salmonella bongori N268-08]|uniref:Uncharacterized protein n=1 Tax=Salmonella bongori N268-08 TaxID=1197719 RepID=S5NF93_SALBN|nr:hypothetical protein A464_1727 [Salmonella bongori N268-08]